MNLKPEDSKILSVERLADGGWLHLDRIQWQTPNGSHHTWESTNRNRSNSAVVLIATLKPSDRIVVIRQFRPPVNRVMLEFPAGLIDPEETLEAAALRELREETGFFGTLIQCFPPAYSSPGMTGESLSFALAEIDENLSGNQNPQTDFDPSECIETLLIPRAELFDFISSEHRRGIGIDAKLFAYALSLREKQN